MIAGLSDCIHCFRTEPRKQLHMIWLTTFILISGPGLRPTGCTGTEDGTHESSPPTSSPLLLHQFLSSSASTSLSFCSALHQNRACNSIPFPSMHNPPLPVRCPRALTQECYKEDTVIRHRFTKPFEPTFNNHNALSLSLP